MTMTKSALRNRPVTGLLKERPTTAPIKRRASRARRSPMAPDSMQQSDRADVLSEEETEELEPDELDDIHTDEMDEPDERPRAIPTRRTRQIRPLPARVPERATRLPRQTVDATPRRRGISPWGWILAGIVLCWLLYTAIWGIEVGLTHLGNAWRFGGHAPTDSLVTSLADGEQVSVTATNTGQQIVVLILQSDSHQVQALTESLSPLAWGKETGTIVPSLTTSQGKLFLHLRGDPPYQGWWAPLEQTFLITPVASGSTVQYHIEQTA